ncbi:hypothetical protein ACQP2U_43365 (plasmid) [Nocardia sp. CA-084685]|uniref:hypothetical protein n=1 Tax=Nocardia sp. CA-084685 TaxID=3239970 RepID=UPI003D95DB2A
MTSTLTTEPEQTTREQHDRDRALIEFAERSGLELDLGDIVHHVASLPATDINNSALDTQIGYLISHLGYTEIERTIRDLGVNSFQEALEQVRDATAALNGRLHDPSDPHTVAAAKTVGAAVASLRHIRAELAAFVAATHSGGDPLAVLLSALHTTASAEADGRVVFVIDHNDPAPFVLDEPAFAAWVNAISEEDLFTLIPHPNNESPATDLSNLIRTAREHGALTGDPDLGLIVAADDHPAGAGFHIHLFNLHGTQRLTTITSTWTELSFPQPGTGLIGAARHHLRAVCAAANTVLSGLTTPA